MAFDLSPVTAEARLIVERAAAVYIAHTQPWLVGLLLYGSVLKGDFIPGCSDIEFHLYLNADAFDAEGKLPLELGLAIQRDLARIDPAPFGYIQCYALPGKVPDGQIGPIPGAYHLLSGELPVAEATGEQLAQAAKNALSRLTPVPEYISLHLLRHGSGKVERTVRRLCTDVWPTLYHVLTLQQDDPIAVWRLPKPDAIALLDEGVSPGQEIRAFDRAVRAYYPAQESVEDMLTVIESGVAFLGAAKKWWDETYAGWTFD